MVTTSNYVPTPVPNDAPPATRKWINDELRRLSLFLTSVSASSNTTSSGSAALYSNTGTKNANTNLDCSSNSFFDITLAGNINVVFQNCATAGNVTSIQLMVRQTANGSNTVTFPNTIRWSDGITPVLTATANRGDVLQFTTFNGGGSWLGAQVYANTPSANVYT